MCAGRRASEAARRVAAALALGLALAAAALGQAPPPTVAAVEVRSDVPIDRPARIWEFVAVRPGEPFSEEAVARTLRNLNAAGRGGEIEAFVEPAADGVRVVFVLWGRVTTREVTIEGELGLAAAELRRAVVQEEGHPLYEDRVFRSVYRLQDLYAERGYLDATVRVAVDEDPAAKTADVTFRVASGEPAMIGEVRFGGAYEPLAPSALLAPLRGKPGERYRGRLPRDDADRLERWLQGQGYRTASVQAAEPVYHAAERRVDVIYTIELGRHFTFEVVGTDRAELDKQGVLEPLTSQRYDEALAVEAVEAIRAHLQVQGHYEATVTREEERTDGEHLVRFVVEPGPTFELERVELEGNEAYSDPRLRALMQTAPRRLLAPGSGRLVDAWLVDDLDNLRSFYSLEGYADAAIGPPLIAVEGQTIALTLPIAEGRRRTVGELTVVGTEAIAPAALLADLPLAAGGPFHPQLLESSVEEVRARYEERGYNTAQIEPELTWSADRSLVAVTLRVFEGPQSVVEQIVVRGQRRTDPGLIRVASGLRRGEPVNRRKLLAAQRQLYALGVFSRVEATLVPGTPYDVRRDVLLRVEEGRRHRLDYGAGFDSEDGPRGLFGFSKGNLFGRAVLGRFDARASDREQQARILFVQPYLWRRPLPTRYSLFGVEEQRESFDSRRSGAQVEVRHVAEDRQWSLLASYKLVETDTSGEPLDIERELQDMRIASLTPGYLIDRRDDPVEPTSGWSTGAQLELAFPTLAADAEFAKLFVQQTGFVGLGRLGVVGASLRLGAIEPGSGAVASELPPNPPAPTPLSDLVPISERFFAGGLATHRAYERDLLGIVGESLLLCPTVAGATCEAALEEGDPGRLVPIGGTGLVLLNVDYRFPIAGAFGGTVFLDAGNVWADWRHVDLSEAKPGAGVGVRYSTPIGPVRLEIGWKLDREELEDPYEVFLSFGNPF